MESLVLDHIYGDDCVNCKYHKYLVNIIDHKIIGHKCTYNDNYVDCSESRSDKTSCGPSGINFKHIEFFNELKFVEEEENNE